jgi:hypothetical protein
MYKRIKKHYLILLITLFTLIVRLYFFRYTDAENSQDSYWLSALARGIFQGKYEIEGEFWGAVQPLYPFLMAILEPLTGGIILSGKLISLLAGVATIPVVYILWKKLESKNVALLAAWLAAVNITAWHLSMHALRDSLFLFFVTLSFVLLYYTRENYKGFPALAIVLGLSVLTRGEGYILTASCITSYVYWKRDYLTKKQEMTNQHKKNLIISAVMFVSLVFPWFYFSTSMSGELVPLVISSGVERSGHFGLNWLPTVKSMVSLPLYLLFFGGVLLVLHNKDEEKYLPLFAYVVLKSASQMWFFAGAVRYALPLLPVLVGFSSVAIFYLLNSFIPKGQNLKFWFLAGVAIVSLAHGMTGVQESEEKGGAGDVVKESMEWFNSNSEPDAKILAGDESIYEYYTDRNVIDYISLKGHLDGALDLASDYHLIIEQPVLTAMISENITYFVAYGPMTPHLYEHRYFKSFTNNFTTQHYTFEYQKIVSSIGVEGGGLKVRESEFEIYMPIPTEVRLIPLKKFEKNNQSVHLYKVEWTYL